MKTLYVSDLDGTLLNGESKLSSESARLLNEAIAQGALFSVATARTPATISTLLHDVDLRIPLVVMTGAALWDSKTNSYRNIRKIDAKRVKKLVNIYTEHHLPTFIYTLGDDNLIHIRHIGPVSDLEQEFINQRIHSPFKQFHIPADGTSHFDDAIYPDATLLFAMQPTDIVRPVYDIIKDMEEFRPNFYHDMYGQQTALLEVFTPEASKANAIKTLKQQTGAERVVVFGDNVNDLPMMQIADVAVAVDNAIDEVKEAADIIIGANTDNSVAKFIREGNL